MPTVRFFINGFGQSFLKLTIIYSYVVKDTMATATPAILNITSSTWLEYDKAQFKSLRAYLTHLSGLLEPYKLNCPPERINAILLTPHAGVRFSGLAGLSTYLPLASNIARIPGTIIIFSTWHDGSSTTNHAILPAFDKIKTPLGMLEVNTELRSLLLARAPHTFSMDTPDNNMKAEHSHIVQYPLIQQVFSKTPIMPLVLPILIPAHSKAKKFTPDIYDLLNKSTYFIACNTDISHVNGEFPARAESYPALVQHDNMVMRYLFGSSQHALNKHKPVSESSACGIGALKWMKEWLRIKMCRASIDNIPLPKYPRLTMYYHSHSVLPDTPVTDITQLLIRDRKLFSPDVSTVGYMGVLITNQPYIDLELPRSMAYYLTDFERLYLRDMARFSVMTQLYYDMSLDELAGYLLWHPAWSIIKRGVFVTIYRTNKTPTNKELRGCIGMIDANTDTVINNVIKYARESAFQDGRFSPITKDEFQQADQSSSFMYEISVLAPKAPITIPEYLEDPDKFRLGQDGNSSDRAPRLRPGDHGILLVQGPNQGFFLPSVATEFKMTKAKQLSELCRKAGIQDVLCYKKPGTKLYYMEGFGFGF